MNNYGTAQFWENRYRSTLSTEDNQTFEWFGSYHHVKSVLSKFQNDSKGTFRVLHVGSGNSALVEDMYADGFQSQYAIDISPSIVEAMKSRLRGLKGVKYELMDACNMTYPSNFFDAIIDKGTLDIFTMSDNPKKSCIKYLKCVMKCLRKKQTGGTRPFFLYITNQCPAARIPTLRWVFAEEAGWDIAAFRVETPQGDEKPQAQGIPLHYFSAPTAGGQFVYVCQRIDSD